ncbi:MAG: hypothetical protein HY998_00865 [candidate division NC10 bacterium]|nr:hypothetical protein [candidate division NC10 bacterium]
MAESRVRGWGIGVPPLVALAEHLGVRGAGKFTVQGSQFTEETHRFNGGSLTSPPEADPEPLASARAKRPRLLAVLGGKTKEEVLCIKDFERLGAEVQIATEDGSLGFKGLITDLLDEFLLTTGHWRLATVYACGPRPMLAEVSTLAARYRISCQVSLETLMACGLGACMGCAVAVQGSGFTVHGRGETVNRQGSTVNQRSYKLVCKDGPVFDAEEIAW